MESKPSHFGTTGTSGERREELWSRFETGNPFSCLTCDVLGPFEPASAIVSIPVSMHDAFRTSTPPAQQHEQHVSARKPFGTTGNSGSSLGMSRSALGTNSARQDMRSSAHAVGKAPLRSLEKENLHTTEKLGLDDIYLSSSKQDLSKHDILDLPVGSLDVTLHDILSVGILPTPTMAHTGIRRDLEADRLENSAFSCAELELDSAPTQALILGSSRNSSKSLSLSGSTTLPPIPEHPEPSHSPLSHKPSSPACSLNVPLSLPLSPKHSPDTPNSLSFAHSTPSLSPKSIQDCTCNTLGMQVLPVGLLDLPESVDPLPIAQQGAECYRDTPAAALSAQLGDIGHSRMQHIHNSVAANADIIGDRELAVSPASKGTTTQTGNKIHARAHGNIHQQDSQELQLQQTSSVGYNLAVVENSIISLSSQEPENRNRNRIDNMIDIHDSSVELSGSATGSAASVGCSSISVLKEHMVVAGTQDLENRIENRMDIEENDTDQHHSPLMRELSSAAVQDLSTAVVLEQNVTSGQLAQKAVGLQEPAVESAGTQKVWTHDTDFVSHPGVDSEQDLLSIRVLQGDPRLQDLVSGSPPTAGPIVAPLSPPLPQTCPSLELYPGMQKRIQRQVLKWKNAVKDMQGQAAHAASGTLSPRTDNILQHDPTRLKILNCYSREEMIAINRIASRTSISSADSTGSAAPSSPSSTGSFKIPDSLRAAIGAFSPTVPDYSVRERDVVRIQNSLGSTEASLSPCLQKASQIRQDIGADAHALALPIISDVSIPATPLVTPYHVGHTHLPNSSHYPIDPLVPISSHGTIQPPVLNSQIITSRGKPSDTVLENPKDPQQDLGTGFALQELENVQELQELYSALVVQVHDSPGRSSQPELESSPAALHSTESAFRSVVDTAHVQDLGSVQIHEHEVQEVLSQEQEVQEVLSHEHEGHEILLQEYVVQQALDQHELVGAHLSHHVINHNPTRTASPTLGAPLSVSASCMNVAHMRSALTHDVKSHTAPVDTSSDIDVVDDSPVLHVASSILPVAASTTPAIHVLATSTHIPSVDTSSDSDVVDDTPALHIAHISMPMTTSAAITASFQEVMQKSHELLRQSQIQLAHIHELYPLAESLAAQTEAASEVLNVHQEVVNVHESVSTDLVSNEDVEQVSHDLPISHTSVVRDMKLLKLMELGYQ